MSIQNTGALSGAVGSSVLGGGMGGAGASSYTISNGGAGNIGFNTVASVSTMPNSLQVNGSIQVTGGDITMDGVSIKELISSITDRLAILTVDPAKIEKYEALKRAYEQYKLLEAMCIDEKR